MPGKPIIDWQNCYQEKWGLLLNLESVAHPAKMARGLVFRIYEYAIEKGYIKPGQWVLDPFFGIGGTALPALMCGINIWGNELEPLFTDCCRGCECSGISKAEWVRFYGRWRRVAYKDRHFCPQCITQAEKAIKATELPLSQASKKRRARIAKLEAILKERAESLEVGVTKLKAKHDRVPPAIKAHKESLANLQRRVTQLKRRAILVSPIPYPEKFNHIAKQADMFGFVLEASYERNSHIIPYTVAHHYTGNLENWQKYAKGDAKAVCTMGDSRHLSGIIAEQVDGSISSPPFIDQVPQQDKSFKMPHDSTGNVKGDYGTSPSQLGNLPPGDLDSIVGSPPYIDSAIRNDADYLQDKIESAKASGKTASRATWGNNAGSSGQLGYGTTDGQLGTLKEGSLDSLLSSPPYANSLDSEKSGIDPGKFKDPHGKTTQALRPTQYGKEEGQLGSLPEGSLDSLISSSPFADSIGSDDPDKRGGLYADPKRRNDKNLTGTYGDSEGQLGKLKDEGFDVSIQADGLVSSPSFAGNTGGRGEASRNGIDPALFDRSSGGMKRGTGENKDNLDHLPMKGFDEVMDGSIGSPPYEGMMSQDGGGIYGKDDTRNAYNVRNKGMVYGSESENIGNSTGPTFWQAAKDILLECHKLLKPGAYSFWVCKNYVKNSQIVPFIDQWAMLCKVCGFEHIETIIAWQIEHKPGQYDTDGNLKAKIIRRQSFFRLLAIKNNPETAIDYEAVLVMRKV